MRKFFKEFKEFISRGNVIDMAVGVIIASAFTAIVTAVTNKIIMPIINWLLAVIVGGNGLDAIYTFLKKAWTVDANGNPIVDLANSIYIDWGALITAIIDFLLIALILFMILKAFNAAHGGINKAKGKKPSKEEKTILREQGVNMKDRKEVLAKTQELRDAKKAEEEAKAAAEAEEAKKNSTEYLLKEIRDLLKDKK